ncbi:uncharacterized protein LOC134298061 [Anolis carolinensis]|uniref:uncharacterized protein LOC134298061 n=1 Tax=Anolis carolinensis TaxID=28377 RepID=UPI002F2B406B
MFPINNPVINKVDFFYILGCFLGWPLCVCLGGGGACCLSKQYWKEGRELPPKVKAWETQAESWVFFLSVPGKKEALLIQKGRREVERNTEEMVEGRNPAEKMGHLSLLCLHPWVSSASFLLWLLWSLKFGRKHLTNRNIPPSFFPFSSLFTSSYLAGEAPSSPRSQKPRRRRKRRRRRQRWPPLPRLPRASLSVEPSLALLTQSSFLSPPCPSPFFFSPLFLSAEGHAGEAQSSLRSQKPRRRRRRRILPLRGEGKRREKERERGKEREEEELCVSRAKAGSTEREALGSPGEGGHLCCSLHDFWLLRPLGASPACPFAGLFTGSPLCGLTPASVVNQLEPQSDSDGDYGIQVQSVPVVEDEERSFSHSRE